MSRGEVACGFMMGIMFNDVITHVNLAKCCGALWEFVSSYHFVNSCLTFKYHSQGFDRSFIKSIKSLLANQSPNIKQHI